MSEMEKFVKTYCLWIGFVFCWLYVYLGFVGMLGLYICWTSMRRDILSSGNKILMWQLNLASEITHNYRITQAAHMGGCFRSHWTAICFSCTSFSVGKFMPGCHFPGHRTWRTSSAKWCSRISELFGGSQSWKVGDLWEVGRWTYWFQ